MDKETMQYLLNLIDNDISYLEDQVRRAENTFRGRNLDELYGTSGFTKRSIIKSYEDRKAIATKAKEALEED